MWVEITCWDFGLGSLTLLETGHHQIHHWWVCHIYTNFEQANLHFSSFFKITVTQLCVVCKVITYDDTECRPFEEWDLWWLFLLNQLTSNGELLVTLVMFYQDIPCQQCCAWTELCFAHTSLWVKASPKWTKVNVNAGLASALQNLMNGH